MQDLMDIILSSNSNINEIRKIMLNYLQVYKLKNMVILLLFLRLSDYR